MAVQKINTFLIDLIHIVSSMTLSFFLAGLSNWQASCLCLGRENSA
jgi:hypothetical protein